MNASKAEKLVGKGQHLLNAGDFRAAEKAFADALKLDEAVPIRNNLALAVFMAGEPRRAMQILEPYTNPVTGNLGAVPGAGSTATTATNPFTHALAARIYTTLGQPDKARRQIQLAARAFEDGLSLHGARVGQSSDSFMEYTVTIMRAAADLKDHRLVLDLYRRWESHHVSWENKFLAAVACFNINRYKRAASLWSSIAAKHQLCASMQQLAFMVERSVIPPFEMSYEHQPPKNLQKMVEKAGSGEEACRCYVQDSYYRLIMLAMILEDDSSQDAGRAVYNLVYHGAEWGEKLGRQLLEYPGFSPSLKLAAVDALMIRGILQEGEPVPMFIEGQMRLVEIKKTPVMFEPDEELDTSLLFQDPSHLVHMYAEEQRRKIEEKPLPVDASLARGLKNMPVHWLEGACEIYGSSFPFLLFPTKKAGTCNIM